MLQLHSILFGFLIVCGVYTCNGLRPRIVNGSKARLGEFPYQAALQVMNFTVCGGVILDKYNVLTAAHCISEYKPGYFSVLVGTVDQNSTSRPGVWHKANATKSHENYSRKNGWPNDIALLRLEKPIVFDKYAQPAILPKTGEELKSGKSALISGFGRLNPQTNGSAILYKTTVFIEEGNEKCQTYYQETIRPTNFCTRPTRVTGTCTGDSGGPITVDGKVVGLASFSLDDGCAGKSMRPQVHTRIREYIDWINDHRKWESD